MPYHDAVHIPIYERIKRAIIERIQRGELSPGDRVPSENELAQTLKVSRSQTRQALRDLEMEGYVQRSRGRPTLVAPQSSWGGNERSAGIRRVVVGCPAHPRSYYTDCLVEAFVNYNSAHGVETMFYYLNLNPDAEIRFLSQVHNDGTAGLALWAVFRTRDVCDIVEEFYRIKFPCVLFDRFLPGLHTDFVGTDNRLAYYDLTLEMLRRGHRAIGYIARDYHDSVQDDRYAGYRRALSENGISLPEQPPFEVGDRGENPNAGAIIDDTLAQHPNPTALVCSDGLVARHVIHHLRNRGIRVPEDIEIGSMDDEAPESWPDIPMVRVTQDGAALGKQAAEMLLARIALPGRSAEQRLLPPKRLFGEEGKSRKEGSTKEMSHPSAMNLNTV